MRFYHSRAQCSECDLLFAFALTENEYKDRFVLDIFCPRCEELVEIEHWRECDEERYDEIIGLYEDLMEEAEDELDFDDDWD